MPRKSKLPLGISSVYVLQRSSYLDKTAATVVPPGANSSPSLASFLGGLAGKAIKWGIKGLDLGTRGVITGVTKGVLNPAARFTAAATKEVAPQVVRSGVNLTGNVARNTIDFGAAATGLDNATQATRGTKERLTGSTPDEQMRTDAQNGSYGGANDLFADQAYDNLHNFSK